MTKLLVPRFADIHGEGHLFGPFQREKVAPPRSKP